MAITIGAFLIPGCKSIDPAVDVPSYISIQSFDLSTTSTEGTDAHQITDVWVLVDDVSIGAYELPASVPILETGKHNIRLFGGIKINGISSSRVIYPFFEDTSMAVTLIPGSTINLSPQISYFKELTFTWLEDFEIGSTLIDGSLSTSNITREPVGTLPEMGSFSGVIRLDATNDYYVGATAKQFNLPKGRPIYLELHYSSNIEFSVGAIKHTLQGSETLPPLFTIFPSNGWNKIYINLTDYIKVHTNAVGFEIYFLADYNSAVNNNKVVLDNIKLIHN